MPNQSKRIFGLDLLRCIAILLVLIAHTFSLISKNSLLDRITYCAGFAGVEVFFVLSGFLIGTILIKTYNSSVVTSFSSIKIFWTRRWFRTLPNYYLIIIIYNLIYYPSYHSLLFGFNRNVVYFFFLQNFFTPMPDQTLAVSWSLSIEEWFYLLFPLLLFGLQYIIKQKPAAFLTLVLFFVFSPLVFRIFFYLNQSNIGFDNGFRKMVPLRLDSISMGVLLSYIQYYYSKYLRRRRKQFFTIGLICIILSLWGLFSERYSEFLQKTLFFTVFSLSVSLVIPYIADIKTTRLNKHFLRTVNFLSIISYSAYLLHPIVILLLQILYKKINLFPGPFITILLIWFLTICWSYLQYLFFESKITALREIRYGLPLQVNRVSRNKG